jgi:putative CocE/NonD family hydrolase
MLRRSRVLFLAVCLLAALVPVSASAQTYPVIEEPVLRPDSAFEETEWGYKLKSLTFPETVHPTAFTMEGYSGASRPMPNMYLRMDDGELMAVRVTFGAGPRGDYASVQASTRGTECSGGSFNLYDRRHAWDGHHIIEWVADQPWSNGNVGMFGSSFPGQTAYWVAATKPPALKAVSANLLHSDIYRDIFMPGGVQNYLFPTLWTYAVGPHRLPQDSIQRGAAFQNDEICQQLQASRYSVGDVPQAQNEPAWAITRSTDDQWYSAHAALTYADSIKIPYYQQTNWQDEQVGPRSVVLFNHINPNPVTITNSDGEQETIIPKKFVASNGDHGHGNYAGNHRWAFFDIFLLGMSDRTGLMDDMMTNYFEAEGNGTAVARKSGDSWPFEDTSYERSYLHEGGVLNNRAPTGAEEADTYISGASRHNWFQYAEDLGNQVYNARGYPDQLAYTSAPMKENFTFAGPILMNLAASIAGTDADFYVSVSDLFPDGRVSFLQRGLLKASHRKVDPTRSYYAADGETLVQPYRPHTNPQPVQPNEIIDYKLEIFPLGYIFRPGHRILIQIHTPPILEKIWGYTPTHHQPAAVTVHHDEDNQSWIQWPVVTTDNPIPAGTTPCPLPGGFFCADASPLTRGTPTEPEPEPTTTPTPTESPTSTPTPTETPTESASPTPTEPAKSGTEVAFTDASAESGRYSDSAHLAAKLVDDSGLPVAGEDLTFELGGADGTETFSATTGADGVGAIDVPLDGAPGDYNLVVRYAGDDTHEGSANQRIFVIEPEVTELDLAVNGTGSKRTLSALLTDDEGDALQGSTVLFFADGTQIGEDDTNAEGVATLAPPSKYRGSGHDFAARFDGDDYYLASRAQQAV